MQRPITIWFLAFFLVLLALGGFSGGIAMLTDPTGNSLQVAEVLPLLPVPNFVLPGIFLLVVLGLVPALLAFALLYRPNWQWINKLFRWLNYYWAWTGTVILVAILAIWLLYEGWLIGFYPITYFTAVLGFLILLFALIPNVRRYYHD